MCKCHHMCKCQQLRATSAHIQQMTTIITIIPLILDVVFHHLMVSEINSSYRHVQKRIIFHGFDTMMDFEWIVSENTSIGLNRIRTKKLDCHRFTQNYIFYLRLKDISQSVCDCRSLNFKTGILLPGMGHILEILSFRCSLNSRFFNLITRSLDSGTVLPCTNN